jgi:hypothetical protein
MGIAGMLIGVTSCSSPLPAAAGGCKQASRGECIRGF